MTRNTLSLEGRGGTREQGENERKPLGGAFIVCGYWRRYTAPLLECHPELVSGSHYSIYPLIFVCKIYEMLKRVQHDSEVRVRYGKKVEKYMRC